MDAGPGAVNFIINHAEIDFIFVQDKKFKQVQINNLALSTLWPDCEIIRFWLDEQFVLQLLSPECVSAQRLKSENEDYSFIDCKC